MGTHDIIRPEGWPRPSGYNDGIRVPPGRSLLFIAGQIAWNTRQELVGGHDYAAQFEQALSNVVTIVESAGGEPTDITYLTMFCVDKRLYLNDLKGVGRAWQKIMGRHYPAMALVEVSALLEEGALVEIQGIAALPPEAADG